jgi:hypothetical protein
VWVVVWRAYDHVDGRAEPRIRVAVDFSALNAMQGSASAVPTVAEPRLFPDCWQFGDTPEIASLIAPRSCLWEVGSHGPTASARMGEQALERIRRAYGAYGAEGNCGSTALKVATDGMENWP